MTVSGIVAMLYVVDKCFLTYAIHIDNSRLVLATGAESMRTSH